MDFENAKTRIAKVGRMPPYIVSQWQSYTHCLHSVSQTNKPAIEVSRQISLSLERVWIIASRFYAKLS